MPLKITEIILLLAAVQGLFLTLVIVQKYRNLYAVRFVGILIFLYSFTLLGLIFNDLNYSIQFPYIYLLFLIVPFVIGPLHYMYSLHLIQPDRRLHKRDLLHFVPCVTVLLSFFVYVYFSGNTFGASVESLDGKTLPLRFIIFNWLIIINISIYSILTIRVLTYYADKIKAVFSSIEKIQLNWFKNITYLVAAIGLVFIFENVLLLFGINLSNYFTLSSVLFAIYVYTLGYLVLMKADIFSNPGISQSLRFAVPQVSDDLLGRQKYQKSGLSEQKAQDYMETIIGFMQSKKPYHDNELTLNQLADMLELTPHNLSEVLNTQLGQNFFDFINRYRVEEVKNALADPGKQNLTLLAIAFEAGFNSKTAFNTIFKKSTGMTPSEYRQHAAR